MVLTAPDECSPQMKQFRMKQIPNTTAGYKVAVYRARGRRRHNFSLPARKPTVPNYREASCFLLTYTKGSFPPPMALQCAIQPAGEVAAEYAVGKTSTDERVKRKSPPPPQFLGIFSEG